MKSEKKHRELLQEKIRLAAEEKERKRLQRLEDYTYKIIYYGLWQSETDVDTLLRNIDGIKEKKDAVKTQLNFRKYVLKQNSPKDGNENVFSFSEKAPNGKTRQLSIEELTTKVKKLVRHSFTIPMNQPEDDADTPILVGKMVKHKFVIDGNEQWWRGKVISQVES